MHNFALYMPIFVDSNKKKLINLILDCYLYSTIHLQVQVNNVTKTHY